MAIVRLNAQQQTTDSDEYGKSLATLLEKLKHKGMLKTPLDIYKVAEAIGLKVEEEIMDDNLSGYLERRGSNWVAGLNALQHRNRQRFTLAHEIAHFVLHRKSASQKFVDEVFARRTGTVSQMEREADRFAAELLMPKQEVQKYIADGETDLLELSQKFGVSSLAMKYRAKELGYRVR